MLNTTEYPNITVELTGRDKVRLVVFGCYFVQGVYLVLANFVIVAAFLTHKKLRNKKEYISICALAVADGMQGVALLSASMYRIPKILARTHMQLVSSRYCLWTPASLMMLAFPMSCHMMLLVSIDRFIAVAWPLQYFVRNIRYAWRVAGAFYLASLGSFVFLFVYGHLRPDGDVAKWPQLCVIAAALGGTEGFGIQFVAWSRITAATGSVVLYIIIPFLHARHLRNLVKKIFGGHDDDGSHHMSHNQQQLYQKHVRTQRHMTVTLGLAACASFVFLIVPTIIQSWSQSKWADLPNDMRSVIGPAAAVITNVNPMLNIVFYVTRHLEMRRAIKGVLTCKLNVVEATPSHSNHAEHAKHENSNAWAS